MVAGPDAGDTFNDDEAGEGVLDELSAVEGFLFKMGRDGEDDGGDDDDDDDGCLAVDGRGGDEGVLFKRAVCSPSTFQDRARDLAASPAWARRLRSSFAADSSDSLIARARL